METHNICSTHANPTRVILISCLSQILSIPFKITKKNQNLNQDTESAAIKRSQVVS